MAKELGVRPLHDRILVKRMPEETKTTGGIIIPDTAKEKPLKGEIVAAGKGRFTEDGKVLPLEVKVGDKLLISGPTTGNQEFVLEKMFVNGSENSSAKVGDKITFEVPFRIRLSDKLYKLDA